MVIDQIAWPLEHNFTRSIIDHQHSIYNSGTVISRYFKKVSISITNISFFSVRLLSVLRGHSLFIPATTANDLRLRRISIQYFIHYIYFPILSLEQVPVFPFLTFSAKQGIYLVPFYKVFDMTRTLTGDWTRKHPARCQYSTTWLSRRRCTVYDFV